MAKALPILLTGREPVVTETLGRPSPSATERTNQLLQENHNLHHIFYNNRGFHNHIVHHLLTIWALGADAAQIQRAYDGNKTYQRDMDLFDEAKLAAMGTSSKRVSLMGDRSMYPTFLEFYQREIDSSTWQEVANRHVFARDEAAESMFTRLFAGLYHPIIHFGFAVEFQQPSIMAEALAQTAAHNDNLKGFWLGAEQRAAARKAVGEPSKTIVQLLDEARNDPVLRGAPHWDDDSKLLEGIVGRAGDRAVDLTSQFHVQPAELQQKTAEMINAACYFTAGAQRTGKKIKYDFFYIHCVNASIFWSSFLTQPWIREEDKVRLLEWKARGDVAMYAAQGAAPSQLDEIRDYRPKQPSGWDEILARVVAVSDDGHAVKLVRALLHGQQVCAAYEQRDEFRVKAADWLQMGHMAVDSVENTDEEARWVRSAGFDEAWEGVPARSQL